VTRRDPGRSAALAAVLAAAVLAPAAARAGDGEVAFGPWVGALVLDPHLADYRWETKVRPVWGASALASRGRLALGARVWRASTRQATGIPGDAASFAVSLTGVDALGEVRLARALGASLLATCSVGLLRLAWSPDALVLDDGLAGAPVTVELDPVHELTGGGGLALRRPLGFGLQAAAAVERTWFALDTSHRRGDEIVTERETFGSWTARVEIARGLFGL
jgi:hypothetical protein